MTRERNCSVALPRSWWYPACRSTELGQRPISVELMDDPIVVYRDAAGRPRALVDRCPHRNVPLSLGRVRSEGTLECGYHGWQFDGDGRCVAVPGLDLPSDDWPTRAVVAHAAREQDGFVWVWAEAGAQPSRDPFRLPELSGRGSGMVVFPADLECTMHAAVENSLDVPHTAFLHGGIFRGGDPHEIVAVRRDLPDGVEVQYQGEPVGVGPVRLRGSRFTFEHWDRFFLPCIAQIEYRVEGWLRIVNTIVHLPMSPFRTRAWFVLQFSTRLPAPIVQAIVLGRGRQILRQDAEMLARQTANVRRFGGERFTSTELDVLGTAVWRLLRQAERQEQAGSDAVAEEPIDPVDNGTPVTFRI